MSSKRNNQQGITQLELLVSLAVMALASVMIANVMSFQNRALDQSDRLAAQVQQNLNRSILIDYIEAIPIEFEGQGAGAFLSGSREELTFRAVVNDGRIWPGDAVLAKFHLSGGLLVLDIQGTSWEQTAISETLSLGTANDLKISYYGLRSEQTEYGWSERWEDKVRLPDLVKIEWKAVSGSVIPISVKPARKHRQSFISLSSRVPPG